MSSIEKTNINLNIGKMNNLIKPKLFYTLVHQYYFRRLLLEEVFPTLHINSFTYYISLKFSIFNQYTFVTVLANRILSIDGILALIFLISCYIVRIPRTDTAHLQKYTKTQKIVCIVVSQALIFRWTIYLYNSCTM